MKKKTPTLSIITICYNIKNEIERTCKSIVKQKWQDFEWIVVDGGSTDGTVDVLKKYQKRINILISEPDKGIYNAMNKGIRLAKGKWLNFMNGGDRFAEDDVLEKVFKNKEYDADVLYGCMNIHNIDGTIQLRVYPDKISKAYFYNDVIGHQSSFIRRELFEKYGMYNEEYRIVSDWEKWIVFAQNNCKFEPLKMIVADFWRGGVGSNMNAKHLYEKQIVKSNYYTMKQRWHLFGFIPLLSIEEQ